MSMFENNQYRWRETYFVLFHSSDRPKLDVVKKALHRLDPQYQLTNPSADNGLFESLTLISPDDFAAIDICYTEGDEVREQVKDLVEELRPIAGETDFASQLKQMANCDARFDVLHFEEVSEAAGDVDDDVLDEALDPSALLLVMNELAKLTRGIAVDPQSGAMF